MGGIGLAAHPLEAQRGANGMTQTAAGHVSVLRGSRLVPMAGAWVTLHRVGSDQAGPVDSVRTDRAGAFTFRYRPHAGMNAAYFVSAMHDGLAYFSPALGTAAADEGSADLTLFDTASRGVPVSIASRHLVVTAPDSSGARQVIEMYVLANADSRTLVSDAHGSSTFSAVLPAGAMRPRAGDGDVPAEAMRFDDTLVAVTAPVPPGSKRVTLDYALPPGTGRFALGRSGAVGLLDVLVEDSAGTAIGAGLTEQPSGVFAGRMFRHFVASEVPPGAMITIDVPPVARGPRVDAVTALVLAVAVAGVAALIALVRRGGPGFDDVTLADGGRSA